MPTPAGHPELAVQLISRRLIHIGIEASPEHSTMSHRVWHASN